jgi:hypothetical protein
MAELRHPHCHSTIRRMNENLDAPNKLAQNCASADPTSLQWSTIHMIHHQVPQLDGQGEQTWAFSIHGPEIAARCPWMCA